MSERDLNEQPETIALQRSSMLLSLPVDADATFAVEQSGDPSYSTHLRILLLVVKEHHKYCDAEAGSIYLQLSCFGDDKPSYISCPASVSS